MKFTNTSLALLAITGVAAAFNDEINKIESHMRKKKDKKGKKDTCSMACDIKPLDADMLIAKVSW